MLQYSSGNSLRKWFNSHMGPIWDPYGPHMGVGRKNHVWRKFLFCPWTRSKIVLQSLKLFWGVAFMFRKLFESCTFWYTSDFILGVTAALKVFFWRTISIQKLKEIVFYKCVNFWLLICRLKHSFQFILRLIFYCFVIERQGSRFFRTVLQFSLKFHFSQTPQARVDLLSTTL